MFGTRDVSAVRGWCRCYSFFLAELLLTGGAMRAMSTAKARNRRTCKPGPIGLTISRPDLIFRRVNDLAPLQRLQWSQRQPHNRCCNQR